jgi:hypothetical protein
MRCAVLILMILVSSFAEKIPKNDVIVWRKGIQLQWEDFKGPKLHKNSVASTTYDILKKITAGSNRCTIEITAVFLPYQSWHSKNRTEKLILVHEQKHFDIAELFARKLRKKLQGETFYDVADLEAKLDYLYAGNDKEMDVYQDLYDSETDHSRNIEQQKKWNEKIESELGVYEDYEAPVFTLPIKNNTTGR